MSAERNPSGATKGMKFICPIWKYPIKKEHVWWRHGVNAPLVIRRTIGENRNSSKRKILEAIGRGFDI